MSDNLSTQMFSHELNPVKGWPSPYAVDKTVGLNVNSGLVSGTSHTALDPALVKPGMVGYKDPGAVVSADAGYLTLGTGGSALSSGIAPMPLFLFQGGLDGDVLGPQGNNTVNIVGLSSNPTNVVARSNINCLVANGAYELETTEFVSGTYVPGQLLTGATGSSVGKVTAAGDVSGTNSSGTILCGTVSDGIIASDLYGGPSRLRFWPTYQIKW